MNKYTWTVNNDLIWTTEYFVNYKECRKQAFEQFYNMVQMINVKIINQNGRIIEYYELSKIDKEYIFNKPKKERYKQLSLFDNL